MKQSAKAHMSYKACVRLFLHLRSNFMKTPFPANAAQRGETPTSGGNA
jgi:hypothetical protein